MEAEKRFRYRMETHHRSVAAQWWETGSWLRSRQVLLFNPYRFLNHCASQGLQTTLAELRLPLSVTWESEISKVLGTLVTFCVTIFP